MNKYLEKIASEGLVKEALNAQKAREMAKKVGVIADPDSNWKYALRNLRDGRGNPLEGQAKREAINRLAGGRDLHREFQQMSAAQRKLRDVDEMQKVMVRGQRDPLVNMPIRGAGHTSEYNKVQDTLYDSAQNDLMEFGGRIMPHYAPGNPQGLSLAHVHPNLNFNSPTLRKGYADNLNIKKVRSEQGLDPRSFEEDLSLRVVPNKQNAGVIPSGGFEQKHAFRHMGKDERRRVYTDDKDLSGIVSASERGDYEAIQNLSSSFNSRTASNEFTHAQKAARMAPMQGDAAAFASAYMGKVNPIYSPSTGAVGLHKTTGSAPGSPILSGHRSIYLDMSPRKTRNYLT